jgi:hypothetical protein
MVDIWIAFNSNALNSNVGVAADPGWRLTRELCYLSTKPHHKIAESIVNATNPVVKRLLLNKQKLGLK